MILKNIYCSMLKELTLKSLQQQFLKLRVKRRGRKPKENLRTLSKKHGGILAGESTGKSGYLATMVIAYIRELIFTQNVLGETMETAVPWSKINQVKSEAHKLIVQLHKENKLPGKPFLLHVFQKYIILAYVCITLLQ